MEPSEYFFDNAVKLSKSNHRIKCICDYFGKNKASIEKLGDQFDFIICSSLLHEIEDAEQMVKDIVNCCNDKTIVHINVPNAYSMHRLLAQESGIITNIHDFSKRNSQFQQSRVFDLGMLREMVMQNGLDVIEEGSYFVKPFSHNQMYTMLKTGIIDEKILDGFYHISTWFPEYGSEIFVNCKVNYKN